jgi:hypothetical protein
MSDLVVNTGKASRRKNPHLFPPRFPYRTADSRGQETRNKRPGEFLRIREATMDDMPSIIGLIEEAAGWLLNDKQTNQWMKPWPDQPSRDKRIRRGIKVGRTWMVENGDGLVGTAFCGRRGNKKLWTQRELSQSAVYLSRLIISRRHAGGAIGADLIEWAGLHGAQSWNAEWIRVDVWTSNFALHSYYKEQGFKHLRTSQFDNSWDYPSAALFQKPTADIDPAASSRFLASMDRR